MVDGVMGAGFAPKSESRPIVSPRYPRRPDLDDVRMVVREELRYKELSEKAKNGELTKNERIELAVLAFTRNADKIRNSTVCYVA